MRTGSFKGALLSTLLVLSLLLSMVSINVITIFSARGEVAVRGNWGSTSLSGSPSDNLPYDHVILIVIDAVRPDVLLSADTPNFDALASEGSHTWNAWTVTPSITIKAVPSIYTGATPEVHGVTDWEGEIYAETLTEVFNEAGLTSAIVGNDNILGGYSATYCTGYYYHPEADKHFTDIAIEWFINYRPFFLALYNPMPDRRGHAYGHESVEYRESIENADYHVGRLVQAIKDLGVYDNTLIVITTDHGMTGTSHGYGYENDMRIFSIWRGPKVKENYQMANNVYIPPSATYGETYVAHRIIDIAPTITALAGFRAPENSEGSVIYQIFEGLVPRAPIHIVGNENFTAANGVVAGSGTENDPYIIENWVINASGANGIQIWNTTAYFIIRNCLVENGGVFYDGIRLYIVVNGKIENCTCDNNYVGILLNNSDNNIVSSAATSNNEYGIYVYYSSGNIISVSISTNDIYGIQLDSYSDSNTVTGCDILDSGSYGVELGRSSNGKITNCTISNASFGIVIRYSNNNTIGSCTISNNRQWGIHLSESSDNNRIYHNNFENNANQAYDNGSNYWDDGYPWGGNYWSDYASVDENHGENQDIQGCDLVGDTPYIISGDNNRDRYPLMNSFPLPRTGWARFLPPIVIMIWPPPKIHWVFLEMNLALFQGRKLVVKFYAYNNVTFEGENVIENFTPPAHVEGNKSVRHPSKCVAIAKLVLTEDNTAEVISEIASFTMRRSHLRDRFLEILGLWFPNPDKHDAFRAEVKDILGQWFPAPP